MKIESRVSRGAGGHFSCWAERSSSNLPIIIKGTTKSMSLASMCEWSDRVRAHLSSDGTRSGHAETSVEACTSNVAAAAASILLLVVPACIIPCHASDPEQRVPHLPLEHTDRVSHQQQQPQQQCGRDYELGHDRTDWTGTPRPTCTDRSSVRTREVRESPPSISMWLCKSVLSVCCWNVELFVHSGN